MKLFPQTVTTISLQVWLHIIKNANRCADEESIKGMPEINQGMLAIFTKKPHILERCIHRNHFK
jgi:hypothetical protein